jgi:hypothetical protein
VTIFDCYVSPTTDVGTNVSGAPGLRKGDCGRFVRTAAGNGQVTHFIRAEQSITALGLHDPQTMQPLTPADIDLDAITVSVDRHIFVSFDADHWVRLRINGALANFPLADGDVACIPAPHWVPNARGEVANVLPNRGVIVLGEPQVSAMVFNAQLTDSANMCLPAFVLDTESLAIDPNGGTFNTVWGNQQLTWPDLLLSGETMTGAGVITTRAGGQIAQVNGVPLARPCGGGPTDGIQMGLAPVTASALAALESLACAPCWFVLGSPTPSGLGGAIEVDIGTNLPVAMAFLGHGLGALPVSPSISFLPWSPNTTCFPELYPAIAPNPLLPVGLGAGWGSARFGSFTLAATPFFGPGVLFQAVAMAGGSLHLSTPVTLH